MCCLLSYNGNWKVNFSLCSGRWSLSTRQTHEVENAPQNEQPKQLSMAWRQICPSAPRVSIPWALDREFRGPQVSPTSPRTVGACLPAISVAEMSHVSAQDKDACSQMTVPPTCIQWENLLLKRNQGVVSRRRDSGQEKQHVFTTAGKSYGHQTRKQSKTLEKTHTEGSEGLPVPALE